MKKQIGKLLIISFLISVSTAATFADQSCSTCGSTSPIIDQYINFSTEMISTLKTMANEKAKAATSTDSNILNRIAQNLNQKWQTALTFTVLMSTIGSQLVGSTVRQEIQTLTNAKAIIRDRDKLDKLDQTIADTLFDLGQAWAYINNTSDYQQRIVSIIDRYSTGSDAFLEKTWTPSSSATTLITALWDLNQAYKRFIAAGKTDEFDAFSQEYSDSLGISIADINYTTLVEQYSCARGFNKCDTTYKKAWQNMASIGKDAAKKAKESLDVVKASLKRLKCTFAKQSNLDCAKSWFTERQNNLLRSLYGIEGPMANQKWSSAIANSMTRLGNSLASQVTDIKDFYIKNDNPSSSVKIPKVTSLDIVSPDAITQRAAGDLSTMLTQTINETIDASTATWQQHVFADPLIVTRNIPRVTIMVYSSINTIGDSEKSKSLTQSLGKSCENQCTNLPGKCYY